MATIELGGPSAPCSIARVRRLVAGELTGEERAKAAAHLLTCERCRAAEREVAAERAQLYRDLPFETFASGVAERLARAPQRRWYRWVPLLAAASVLVIAVPVAVQRRAIVDDGVRSKGSALVQLYVKDARGLHPWLPGEEIAESADVHAELRPGKQTFAAVALLEGGDAHALYSGPARVGHGSAKTVAFGWTGAHGAILVVALGPKPIDVQQLAHQLRESRAAPPPTEAMDVESIALPRGP
jgi:hypothetical protein